jgi:cytochrome c oxidase subunit 3
MTVTLVFLAGLMALVVWWLIRQTINSKPWIAEGQQGATEDFAFRFRITAPALKVSLGVFLAVVTSLFALFISAYSQRMELSDWRPAPEPTILWINTAVLVLTSVAMQWSHLAAKAQNLGKLKKGLLVAGALTSLFLVGQIVAWQEMIASGYYLDKNPANSFFYLLTALHGLHLLGGMIAWMKTTANVFRGVEVLKVSLNVELCAVYWHYLLLLWLVLFGLLLST